MKLQYLHIISFVCRVRPCLVADFKRNDILISEVVLYTNCISECFTNLNSLISVLDQLLDLGDFCVVHVIPREIQVSFGFC